MRGRDPDSGEFLGPSRSQRRREALEVFTLAERLVALSPAQLAPLPLSEALLGLLADTRAMTAHGARKRQLQFLAKALRREEPQTLEAIRHALDHERNSAHRETAALHQIEAWRDRLLAEGDGALTELLAEHPAADRQRLRQLIRQAHRERETNAPPHAFRELFRLLREMLSEG